MATVYVAVGREARLRGSPREGPESAPKPSFHSARVIGLAALLRPPARALVALLPPGTLITWAQRSRSDRASLHVRIHEGVGVLLRLLCRLLVMHKVMSEIVHRLLEWHVEGVSRARENDDFHIGLALGCLA
jgi:hypothetical protein